jgi:hypothetical protein
MNSVTVSTGIQSSRKSGLLIPGVLGLWLFYTALQSASLAQVIVEPFASILSLLPGLLGIGVLLPINFKPSDLYLRLGGISKVGLALYAAMIILYWYEQRV